MTEKEYKKYFWKQVSLPVEAAEKLLTLASNFKYGKSLKKAKTIEAMAWQYDIIKICYGNDDRVLTIDCRWQNRKRDKTNRVRNVKIKNYA